MSESQMQKFQKMKTFVHTFFTSITDLTLPLLRKYFKNLQKQSSTNPDNYSSVSEILNNTVQAKGKKALHYACARGDVQIVKFLIQEYKADINVKDSENYTPFFTAIQHERFELIKYLVQQLGLSINSFIQGNIYAIHLASNNNSLSIMEYLISKGADIEKLSIYGKPLNWAVGHNNTDAALYLLEKGADPNGDTTGPFPAPLILAIDFDNKAVYDKLLEKGASLDVKDPKGYSVLHVACQKGNKNLTSYFIEKGVDVNYEAQGKTPLYLAFQNQKWQIVQILRNKVKKFTEIQKQVKEAKIKSAQSKLSKEEIEKKSNEHKTKGNKFYEQKNFQQAIQQYTKAISYDPNNNILYSNKAAAYISLKNYEKAIQNCQIAKSINPKHIKTLFRQGQSYFALKNYIEAAGSYWQALKLQPNNKQCLSEFNKCVALGKEQHQNNKA